MGKIKDRHMENMMKLDEFGYTDDYGNVNHNKMASSKVWLDKQGGFHDYESLTDKHLEAILQLLEVNKMGARQVHYKGLLQEKARRSSPAGEVLFGKKV